MELADEGEDEADASACCCEAGGGFDFIATVETATEEAVGFPGVAAGGVAGELAGGRGAEIGAEPAGGKGFGAETPAISDPRPIFCKLGASSFPLGSRPLAD